MIRVGPCGWSHPDWEGRVYPRDKPPGFHPLAHLARYFDCIEVDSTFYAYPRRETVERWAQLVRERASFRFFAQLHRDFTHAPESDRAQWDANARAFREGLEPLQREKRLAGVLVQFPVSFLFGNVEVRRLGRIRELLDGLPLILEVRHESWFTPPALASVRGVGHSLAYVDLPPAWNHPPAWHEPTGPIGYVRLHGRNDGAGFRAEATRDERFDYLYGADEIELISRRAERVAELHDTTAVLTNNHTAGNSVANAFELLSRLRRARVAAPAEIVESFPRLAAVATIDGQRPLF